MTKIFTAQELFDKAVQAHRPEKPNNHEYSTFMRESAHKGHGEAQYTMGLIALVDGKSSEKAKMWFNMVVNNEECEHALKNKTEAQAFLDTLSNS